MAVRVTEADVREIIDTTLGTGEIDPFIITANMLVNGYLGSSSLDETVLTEIEKYMSAHVLSVKDQRVSAEKIDVLSFTYTGTFGEGLKNTQYGQMTILLDTTGTLGKLAQKGFKGQASISVMEYHNES
jgi:hypothetical protein